MKGEREEEESGGGGEIKEKSAHNKQVIKHE